MKKINSKYLNINRCALFQVESYIEVPVELYCIMKELLRNLNDTIDVLGNAITFEQIA